MEKVGKIFKEHTMQIILVLVVIFFAITTKGSILSAMNFEALITQNYHYLFSGNIYFHTVINIFEFIAGSLEGTGSFQGYQGTRFFVTVDAFPDKVIG